MKAIGWIYFSIRGGFVPLLIDREDIVQRIVDKRREAGERVSP
jgi:hypothetical protein